MARRGRPRKPGKRYPSGGLVPRHPDDDPYRALSAQQPHRRSVPENLRLDHRAESLLGRLFLSGVLAAAGDDPAASPSKAELRYEAGARYAAIVGSYRAVIGTPAGTSGSGRGFGCVIDATRDDDACRLEPETCACLRRKVRYEAAFEALMKVGQRAAKAVARVAIHGEALRAGEIVYLIGGLDVLVVHFGLTTHAERRHSRITN